MGEGRTMQEQLSRATQGAVAEESCNYPDSIDVHGYQISPLRSR